MIQKPKSTTVHQNEQKKVNTPSSCQYI